MNKENDHSAIYTLIYLYYCFYILIPTEHMNETNEIKPSTFVSMDSVSIAQLKTCVVCVGSGLHFFGSLVFICVYFRCKSAIYTQIYTLTVLQIRFIAAETTFSETTWRHR